MNTRYLPTAKKYLKLIASLPDIIEESGFKETYLRDKLEISRRVWYNRKKVGNWTPEEVLKLLEIIEGKDK